MFDELPPLATSILEIKCDEDDDADDDDDHSPQGQALSVCEENDDNVLDIKIQELIEQ